MVLLSSFPWLELGTSLPGHDPGDSDSVAARDPWVCEDERVVVLHDYCETSLLSVC